MGHCTEWEEGLFVFPRSGTGSHDGSSRMEFVQVQWSPRWYRCLISGVSPHRPLLENFALLLGVHSLPTTEKFEHKKENLVCYIDGLVHNCSIPIANALQSLIYNDASIQWEKLCIHLYKKSKTKTDQKLHIKSDLPGQLSGWTSQA